MERSLARMDVLMVLTIEIMMFNCLNLWMALDIILMMSRLTVHCLVLRFKQTMYFYSEK